MSRPAVALVPARAGSTRVPGKNVRPLAGHPLIAYTLAAAHQSGLFEAVVVSTDSEEIAAVARDYGGEVPAIASGRNPATSPPYWRAVSAICSESVDTTTASNSPLW